MADTKRSESSVLMALSELQRMEQDRIESDREREARKIAEARIERERAEAAAREAERQRAEQAAQKARVAEAEARLRVEADRERDQRIAAMRAELARVEQERQAMRDDLEQRRVTPPARTNGWALAFGLSSLVAASLAGLLVMQQGTRPMVVPVGPAATPVVFVPAPHGEDMMVRADDAPAAPAPVVESAAPAPVHPRRHRVDHTSTVETAAAHGHDLVGLGEDDGNDDVLGPELVRDAHRSLHP